jgi:RNA polymerase sigma-70 factor (ECF subfamily)
MLAVRMGPSETQCSLPAAFDVEAEALRPAVRAVAAAILRESRMHPDVEDCANETMRRALEGRARLRDSEPLRPWLLGIARHVALDLLRVRMRDRRARIVSHDDGQDDLLERVPDSTPSADEQLERARRAEHVQRAMRDLPDDHRRAVEMFHVDGMAYREIAELLGVPVGTVCTWISRGRRAIATALERQGVTA